MGKCIFATALLHDFKWCVGIEIIENLVTVCKDVYETSWRELILDGGEMIDIDKKKIDFQFLHGDAAYIEWQDGDVVFMNSTCFSLDTRQALAKTANKMRAGSLIMTVSLPLLSEQFELLDLLKMNVTWGHSTVFIYRKKKM